MRLRGLRCWVLWACACLLLPTLAFGANTHNAPDETREQWATHYDMAVPFLVAPTCLPAVPGGGGGLTFGAFSCSAYVQDTTNHLLIYVTQPATSVGPLNSGDGTYWLGLHKNVSGAVASWTRQTGTHYLWLKQASQPANPDSVLVFAQVTIAGGIIGDCARGQLGIDPDPGHGHHVCRGLWRGL